MNITSLELALDRGERIYREDLPEWEVYEDHEYLVTLPARDRRSALAQAARLAGNPSTRGLSARLAA